MSPQSRRRRPKRAAATSSQSQPSRPQSTSPPAQSARYTPRIPVVRFRPTSHKVVGGVLVFLGVVIAVLNDVARLGPNVVPGGHSELYLLLGVAVAGYGGWWFGIFDRPR